MKLICDFADPAARVTADAGQQRQTLVRQLVTDTAAKPRRCVKKTIYSQKDLRRVFALAAPRVALAQSC